MDFKKAKALKFEINITPVLAVYLSLPLLPAVCLLLVCIGQRQIVLRNQLNDEMRSVPVG